MRLEASYFRKVSFRMLVKDEVVVLNMIFTTGSIHSASCLQCFESEWSHWKDVEDEAARARREEQALGFTTLAAFSNTLCTPRRWRPTCIRRRRQLWSLAVKI